MSYAPTKRCTRTQSVTRQIGGLLLRKRCVPAEHLRTFSAAGRFVSQMKANRLVKLGASAMLFIGLGACYLYFWQNRPIGIGPAGSTVPAVTFSRVSQERQYFVVGIGDSVTAGFGSRRGFGYFDRLVTSPSDEFEDMKGKCLQLLLPHLQFTNLAISGSTSGEHVARQLPRLPVVSSNTVGLIFVTTGGNDLIHNYGRTPPREEAMYGATWDEASPSINNFELRVEKMIVQINVHFPAGCHIFLANIFDPTAGVGDIQRAGLPAWKDGLRILAAYNDVIRRCSERHSFVRVVDIHRAFLGHGIHCTQFWSSHYDSKDPHYWYYVNLEDPNERGYDAMRRLFLLEIAKASDQFQ